MALEDAFDCSPTQKMSACRRSTVQKASVTVHCAIAAMFLRADTSPHGSPFTGFTYVSRIVAVGALRIFAAREAIKLESFSKVGRNLL